MKDYTFAQKDEFVKAMQIQLTALNPDLDKLALTLCPSAFDGLDICDNNHQLWQAPGGADMVTERKSSAASQTSEDQPGSL